MQQLYNDCEQEVQSELHNHHIISIDVINNIRLYFMKNWCCYIKKYKNSKLVKLYKKSSEKIEKAFDIVKIIKNL